MSIFDMLDQVTSQTVDTVHATTFACQPMRSTPNGRPSPDPERAALEGSGILGEVPAYHAVEIGARQRTGNDIGAIVPGQSRELSVDRTRYPAADATRQGDRFTVGSRTFDVLEVRPDGLSRIVFALALVRAR